MWTFFGKALGAVPSWARVIILFVIIPALFFITAWFIYTVTISITAAMQNGREVEIKTIGLRIPTNCQTLRDAITPLTQALETESSEWRRNLDYERKLQTELRDKANREGVATSNRDGIEKDIDVSRARAEKLTGIPAKIDDVKDKVEALINKRC
jgi:hypothetical protein